MAQVHAQPSLPAREQFPQLIDRPRAPLAPRGAPSEEAEAGRFTRERFSYSSEPGHPVLELIVKPF